MERRTIETIIRTFNDVGVRYLIAGGLAVVAHGLVRFTADLDLVLDPDPESMMRAIVALQGLGYRPRAPVDFREFADPAIRARWKTEKGMTVFSATSDQHFTTEIDLFLEPPFDFETAYARAARFDVGNGIVATFVAMQDLVDMKRAAGRPRDLLDIEGLRSLDPRREEDRG